MKRCLLGVLAVVLVFALTACGTAQKVKDQPTADIAKKIVDTLEFEDELMQMQADIVGNFYNLPDDQVAEYAIYTSSSMATAEEIAVIKAKDSGAVDQLKKELEDRLNDKMQQYENYRPEQVAKIENAKIQTKGNYLLLAIANDSAKAAEIFDEMLTA